MQALSKRNDDPERASRPYDTDRDGFVMGEGAAVIVLESEEHAKARGAKIYAEFAGLDERRLPPHRRPGARGRVARDGGGGPGGRAQPPHIIHVNAHATSTPVGDVAEANAIRRAFGSDADGMAISATKSMTGHLLGAAGALEGVLTILAVHHRIAPAAINIDNLTRRSTSTSCEASRARSPTATLPR